MVPITHMYIGTVLYVASVGYQTAHYYLVGTQIRCIHIHAVVVILSANCLAPLYVLFDDNCCDTIYLLYEYL